MARALAAAELRVVRSRRDLSQRLGRLGARLSRPWSLAAVVGAAALAGFAIRRVGRPAAMARTLGAALLRNVMPLYVRYRTAHAAARGQHVGHETIAPNEHPVARPAGLRRRNAAR